MTPHLFDHVIAFTILVLMPILGVPQYRRLVAAMRADPALRRRAYRNIIAQQWVVAAIVLVAWFAVGRERAAIGLDLPGGIQAIIGFAITAAVVVALQLQTLSIRRGGEAALVSLRAQFESVKDLMPRTQQELRWFRGLGFTAGVCEEVLFRGFLLAYLAAYIGTWPAVVAGAVTFGIVHLYQGRANALKGCIFGLLAGTLYIGCGTLLWPMIVHAALDLNGATLARLALVDRRE